MSPELKQRLLTAAVLIPLFIWGVLALPTSYFSLFVALVVLQGAWEWAGLAGWRKPLPRMAYVAFIGALFALWFAPFFAPEAVYAVTAAAVVWWVGGALWLMRIERAPPPGVEARQEAASLDERVRGLVMGTLVLVPPWLAIATLHASPLYGPGHVLFLFFLIWIADTAAYFAGRRWGRHKLAPRISPGKTWEGAAGALAGAGVFAAGGGWMLGYEGATLAAFMAVCAVTVVFSIVGDLLESLFKRRAGVKDSGTLLPGHGGALDRIDSLTAAAPVFYFGAKLVT